jgi:hypothetical protein
VFASSFVPGDVPREGWTAPSQASVYIGHFQGEDHRWTANELPTGRVRHQSADTPRTNHARQLGKDQPRSIPRTCIERLWPRKIVAPQVPPRRAVAASPKCAKGVGMQDMLLKPGKTCDEAIRLLDGTVQGGLNDTRNAIPRIGSPGFPQLMQSAISKYESWTSEARRQLLEIFLSTDLSTRLRGEKFWLIVAGDTSSPRTASMMHTELTELTTDFNYAANELRILKWRFSRHRGRCLVVDTNDFLHYQRFDLIPWSTIYRKGAWVVVPHVVLDEIDRKSYEESSSVRKRARGVYRIFERLLSEVDEQGYTSLRDGSPCLILADEPGHRRMPNNDDEIVARAGFVSQALVPGQVTLITRDIGMRARAMARRLESESLPEKYLITDGLSSAEMEANLATLESRQD